MRHALKQNVISLLYLNAGPKKRKRNHRPLKYVIGKRNESRGRQTVKTLAKG